MSDLPERLLDSIELSSANEAGGLERDELDALGARSV